MNINFRTLQNRILVLFIFTLMVTISVILVVTLGQTYQHSETQLNNHFKTSQQVLLDKFTSRSATLARGLNTLGKDFSTKQLIADAENDKASLLSALNNHQKRLNADFSVVLNSQGNQLVSNVSHNKAYWPVEELRKSGISMVELSGNVYLTRAWPVKFLENSPNVDAWLVMGINVANMVHQDMKSMLGFDVTLLKEDAVVASSYTETIVTKLTRALLSLQISTRQDISATDMELTSYHFSVTNSTNYPLEAVFTVSTDLAYVNYQNLILRLSVVIAIMVVLVLFLSFSLAKGIAKPLKSLANVAREIQKGNYPEIAHDKRMAEVETLSFALSGMQDAIQLREKENYQLAYYSKLTGLPNRNHFMQQMNSMIATNDGDFAVIMMDIDRFKDINDTLGHEYGDLVLKQIAHRLECNKAGNAFLAYLDGDEFAALVPLQHGAEPKVTAEHVAHLFDQDFEIQDVHLDISTSIGVALYPQHAKNADALMQFADIALYAAKDQHHSVEIYRDELNTHSVLRLSLMSELRSAIDKQQLKLHYQPKVNVATKEVVSVECLVRWQHPEHGFIFPDDFIPLAEQTGTIRHLTHWAIETALQKYVEVTNAGHHIHMAVNISTVDLIDLDLPPFVAMKLSNYKVAPENLTLEVTESAIMSDPENALSALAMLRNMGIKLSIDDFGTGYSSMEQLKRTPVHELKIDKSFVLELAENSDDAIIVKSIADLAHNLGLTIVAEGVENEASLNKLGLYDVETAQGYFISKPIPSDDLLPWLDAYAEKIRQNDE